MLFGCQLSAKGCKHTLAPPHSHSPLRACSLPPSPSHSSLCNQPYTETRNKRQKSHAFASPPTHGQHISPQLPGQLSLLALHFSSHPTPAAAGTCPPPAPSPTPALAVPSPPSIPRWLPALCPSPRQTPCANPPGTGTRVCQLPASAAHSLAAQPVPCPCGWTQTEMETWSHKGGGGGGGCVPGPVFPR